MTTTSEKATARAERIGSSIATYRGLRVPYTPQQEVALAMDELRHVGLQTQGEAQEVLVILEATFSGKTSAALMFKRSVERQMPKGSTARPVVLATAAASCSSRALVKSLLRALDVRFAPGMTEDAMWNLWPDACRRNGVQIAIIDEVQHAHDGKFSKGVTNTLKNQLAVNVPLVVLGTRDADALFKSNDDFCSRTYDTLSLSPMKWGVTLDEAIWTKLCKDLDAAMVKADVVDEPSNLGDFAEPLCRAALGRIGLLKKIVQTALRLALRRHAQKAVRVEDLAGAVDVWSIRHGYLSSNPFRGSSLGQ